MKPEVSRKDAETQRDRIPCEYPISRFAIESLLTLRFLCASASLREKSCICRRDWLYCCADNWRGPRIGIGFAGRMGRGRATRRGFRASGPRPTICGRSRCRASGTARRWFGTSGCSSRRAIRRRASRLCWRSTRKSGEQLWEKRFASHTYAMHADNSYATSTPAVDADQLYVLWLDGDKVTLAALTHDGDRSLAAAGRLARREAWLRHVADRGGRHGVRGQRNGRRRAQHGDRRRSRRAATFAGRVPRGTGKTSFATPLRAGSGGRPRADCDVEHGLGRDGVRSGDGRDRVAGARAAICRIAA